MTLRDSYIRVRFHTFILLAGSPAFGWDIVHHNFIMCTILAWCGLMLVHHIVTDIKFIKHQRQLIWQQTHASQGDVT